MRDEGAAAVLKPASFEQALGGVDAKAVHAAVEPESQYVLEHRRHVGVAPVLVGLARARQIRRRGRTRLYAVTAVAGVVSAAELHRMPAATNDLKC